ncbi:MAG: cytochrome c3 family protein [Gammaproteobacteria bacterium]|nr:cytochrome c3 family protein [Gammaproteobacteria bacterium]MDH5630285.1 cytochrome c3 family protein [Gammaproteobacteria bacterium]
MNSSFKILIVLAFAVFSSSAKTSVLNTLHNLSASGPGTVKAVSDQRVCIFCHTPHTNNPIAPLWNREQPALTYIPYTSSTAKGTFGQPTGDSLLCLSCHDGTIALGKSFATGEIIQMVGGNTMPAGIGLLSQDLSNDHPISFVYNSALAAAVPNGELNDPSVLASTPMKLDANGELQCSTCHDAHDNTFGKFLVMSNQSSAMCTTCHNKQDWNNTFHNLSTATWDGVPPNPWPFTSYGSVNENGCQNCHQPHSTGQGPRLLNYAAEEDTCLACHNGHVANATKDIAADFAKISSHPVAFTSGDHQPGEPNLINGPRHVECVDCHDPHAVQAGGFPSSALVNIPGIDANGLPVATLSKEYELCYRCHSDNTNAPPPTVNRVISSNNIRLKFDPTTSISSHPVNGPRRNMDVPSLIPPWDDPNTQITCGDCHGSDNPNVKGPHGSNNSYILKKNYTTSLDTPSYQTANFELCYQCHSETVLLSDLSYLHTKHTSKLTCSACHDIHGVPAGGNAINNSRLINFNTDVIFPNRNGLLEWVSEGQYTGSCYLDCHRHNHRGSRY